MQRSTVHLVRHGEVHNPEGVLYGRLPEFHLSDLGREMAAQMAGHFEQRRNEGANLVLLVASPLARAQETAQPVADALGLQITTDERIIEAENRFEGMSKIKSRLRQPRYWPLLVNPFRPSWGEPYSQQAERVMEGVHAARRRALELAGSSTSDAPAEAILVSHQLPIWVTRLAAERRRLWHDPRQRECTLTSVTSIDFDGDTIRRVRYAEPCADLLPGAANVPGA
ncbi:MAG: Fructose-2,6-bisphosphatase [Micrococcaceae bacterium]|jgi:broad specificity phosphatase PhoE|uniref:Histidine phosphatase family protein n=1 Tax=Arthrobacter cheniae TaxID=1258888 RepID=A0A3A5M641_9MICC|nr:MULTISPECIES: histidine phosphatase family protein [Arthrobacter]MCU1632726.1 Fructose-2,6-bisphosphatase [Micrococcaceae bacterium]MEC5198886.1 broad specificity phosphatase PhoE [Arthrobacter sp. PL16]RJT83190.1 histidine phosphatase family protein [Arthrobacter cheniae]